MPLPHGDGDAEGGAVFGVGRVSGGDRKDYRGSLQLIDLEGLAWPEPARSGLRHDGERASRGGGRTAFSSPHPIGLAGLARQGASLRGVGFATMEERASRGGGRTVFSSPHPVGLAGLARQGASLRGVASPRWKTRFARWRSNCVLIPPSGWRDSNPRPPEPHSGALPSCATARFLTVCARLRARSSINLLPRGWSI